MQFTNYLDTFKAFYIITPSTYSQFTPFYDDTSLMSLRTEFNGYCNFLFISGKSNPIKYVHK